MIGWLRVLAIGFSVFTTSVQAGGFDAITPIQPAKPVPIMVNLASLDDWGTQQPFIDRMKVARAWIGHLPGRWGGLDHDDLAARGLLDENGWPTSIPGDLSSIGTLVMTDLPEEAVSLAGRYVVRFEGNGIVELAGRATNVRYGKNRVTFDFSPGSGGVEIKIQRSDRAGRGDYVRNITVMREDRIEAYDQGAIFNPDFLDVISGFSGLRFVDWMDTNHSELQSWAERPRPGDYTYTWRGIPVELMLELSNTLRAAPWLTLPHKADDEYFRKTAEAMKAGLDPSLPVYVEYSNEVWNWRFGQAIWAEEQSMARWNVEHQWMQFYGMRAAQMARIWRDVFADRPDQLTTVFATQAGWLGLEEQALDAPLWRAEDPANPAPYTLFDAYAITGYINPGLGGEERAPMVRAWIAESEAQARSDGIDQGLTGEALATYVERNRYANAFARAGAEMLDGRISGNPRGSVVDLMNRVLPHHRDVAAERGMDLIMYEGGTHVVGLGEMVNDVEQDLFFRAFNYSDEMGALYTHLIAGWAEITDGPFNIYNDVGAPSKWGSWGGLRHLSDQNPRWDAILQFRAGAG